MVLVAEYMRQIDSKLVFIVFIEVSSGGEIDVVPILAGKFISCNHCLIAEFRPEAFIELLLV